MRHLITLALAMMMTGCLISPWSHYDPEVFDECMVEETRRIESQEIDLGDKIKAVSVCRDRTIKAAR